MVERNQILHFLTVHQIGRFQHVGSTVPAGGGIAKLPESGGKLQHRVPRLLQVVFPADDSGLYRQVQVIVLYRHGIAKLPRFMLEACQDR